jgi:HPt (histidine-containing phosphotransfer) domain-containing protein
MSESRNASGTAAPLDLEQFNRLTDGDREFARDLATAFAGSGNQQLLDISAALEAADRGALARAAHKLKGASVNIYAQVLSELAASLEAEAPTSELVRLQQVSAALRHEFERTNEYLAANLPAPSEH